MLLPGVPVANVEQLHLAPITVNSTKPSSISELEKIRENPSFMHGSFDVFANSNKTVVGYSR